MKIPIEIPPGAWRNGTFLQAGPRWFDVDLMRWEGGVMEPVKGWVIRATIGATSTYGTASGGLAWISNAGDKRLAVGTDQGLFLVEPSGAIDDITPAGWTDGTVASDGNTGFGGGLFGSGTYGTATIAGSIVIPADTWSMDNWGENLIAVATHDQRILEWAPGDPVAAAITGSPTCTYAMVTEERFVFALGADGDPRQLRWSDREDNTTWTPSATNEAGDWRASTPCTLLSAHRSRGETVILSDNEAFVARYVGPPFVYGLERVGSNCGVVGRRAAAVTASGAVVWLGATGFYIYEGGSVRPLPCDILDWIYGDDFTGSPRWFFSQVARTHAFTNVRHNEIWWWLGEGRYYVLWDYEQNLWSYGHLERQLAVDNAVYGNPYMVGLGYDTASQTLQVYEHETGFSYPEAASATVYAEPYAQTGMIQLGDGDRAFFVRRVYPDGGQYVVGESETTGTLSFYGRWAPGTGNTVDQDVLSDLGNPIAEDLSLYRPTDTRFAARELSMRVAPNPALNGTWRAGRIILDAVPGGRR